MKRILEAIVRLFLQPGAMVAWAVGFVLAFGITHSFGWREFTSLLSGTIPNGESPATASLKAGAYLADRKSVV